MIAAEQGERPDDAGSRRWVEARLAAAERLWGPRAVRADDGVAAGRRQVDLRALGGLSVTVECDQFLDLGDAWFRGVPLSFTPASTSPRADSWTRRWTGGLLTTCGLSAVGRAGAELGGTHGRASITPATVTRRGGQWVGDAYEVAVAGIMREAALFEQNVTVERTITGRVGVGEIQLADVIRNEGFAAEAVRILYHVNLGWPFLDETATVAAQARPAGGGSAQWTAPAPRPRANANEIVDALVPVADPDGWSHALLGGAHGTVVVAFRPAQLEYLTIWRSPAAGSYAVGLEPGTCWPSHVDAPDAGKAGRLLEPGETLTVDLRLRVRDRDVETNRP